MIYIKLTYIQDEDATTASTVLQCSVAKYTAAAELAVWAEEKRGRVLPQKPRGFEEQQVMTNHLLREILKGI